MGAFATGILLFGIALLYGATGTFALSQLAAAVADARQCQPAAHALHRHSDDDYRHRLQGVGRAVPLLDARRVRGHAHLLHRLHEHGGENGRFRRFPQAAGRGPARRPGLLDAHHSGHVRPHAAARQRGRGGPDQHQAHAGLLQREPRRLPAHRPRGQQGHPHRRCRQRHFLLLAGLFHRHGGRLRGAEAGGRPPPATTPTPASTAWAKPTRCWPS